MTNIEFSETPDGDVLIKEKGKPIREFSMTDSDLINEILARIKQDYPEAYIEMANTYNNSFKNQSYFNFLIVRRFIKCNFQKFDSLSEDIDSKSNFNFEDSYCPMRGECNGFGVICRPQFNNNLTERESQILSLWGDNKSIVEVANETHISKFTVVNHIHKIYKKLCINSQSEAVEYCNIHNIK